MKTLCRGTAEIAASPFTNLEVRMQIIMPAIYIYIYVCALRPHVQITCHFIPSSIPCSIPHSIPRSMFYSLPPSGAKKHRESTEPESRQTAKMFFRRASSNLRDSFTMVFAQNSSIFYCAVHQPIAFFHVQCHTRRFEPLTEELWLPLQPSFLLHERMRANHLAMKCNYYARLLN